MNFIEAVRLAKEGKKIRRPTWKKDEWYISVMGGIYDNELCWTTLKDRTVRYMPMVESILANDWEVVE